MASGRRKKFVEVESNRNLFEFFTRNESESDPAKIVRSTQSNLLMWPPVLRDHIS